LQHQEKYFQINDATVLGLTTEEINNKRNEYENWIDENCFNKNSVRAVLSDEKEIKPIALVQFVEEKTGKNINIGDGARIAVGHYIYFYQNSKVLRADTKNVI